MQCGMFHFAFLINMQFGTKKKLKNTYFQYFTFGAPTVLCMRARNVIVEKVYGKMLKTSNYSEFLLKII